jgi:drug/metabolite transporter (DMT)-like permease
MGCVPAVADLALAGIMAIWGSTFAVVRTLVGGSDGPVSPMLLVAVRMALASVLLLCWLALRGERRFSRALWRDGLVCAALLGAGFLLQIEGQHRTTASRSGFLTGLLVVFVPVLELILFRKRPSVPAAAGIALAFTGMALLSRGGQAGQAQLTGDLLTVGCAVVFAGHIIALGRVAGRHPVLPLLLVQLLGTGAMAAVAGPVVERQHFASDPRAFAAVAYLAVFATLLAFGVQTWAQRKLPPVRMALLSALEPAFAAGWAAVLIGERLSRLELWGGALIVLGVLVGETGAALFAHPRGTSA